MQPNASLDTLLTKKGRQVWSVLPGDSVYQAIEKMADRGVGALLVIENGRLVGLISERDYTRKVILQGKSSRDTRVEEIMTREVVTAEPWTTVEDAMRLMTARRIRHLPVVEGMKVVGVISIGDTVKWILSAQESQIAELKTFITGVYPG